MPSNPKRLIEVDLEDLYNSRNFIRCWSLCIHQDRMRSDGPRV